MDWITRELRQRINQAASAAGAPAVLDAEFEYIDEIAHSRAQTSIARIGPLDKNPMAQALVSEWMQEILRPGELDREVRTDLRWHPRYDQTDIFSAHIYGIVRSSETSALVRVPITDAPTQWRDVGVAYLSSRTRCQAHLQDNCAALDDDATDTDPLDLQCYPIKRSDFVFIVWMCAGCRERLNDPYTVINVQTEPRRWRDDGPNFDDDPFDDSDPWA